MVGEAFLCHTKRSLETQWGRKDKDLAILGSRFGRSDTTRPKSRFGKELTTSPRRRFGDSFSIVQDTDSDKLSRSSNFRNKRKRKFTVHRLGRDMLIGYYNNNNVDVETRSVRPRKSRKGRMGRLFGRGLAY